VVASELARDLWYMRTATSLHDLAKHYRRLCKLYHPDLRLPDQRAQYERHMQQINEAYTEALKRFNIYTYASPKPNAPTGRTIHVELIDDPPPSAPRQQAAGEHRPPAPPAAQPEPRHVRRPAATAPPATFTNTTGQRQLASARATLQQTRTFFSLHGTDEPRERELYQQALGELQTVQLRSPGTAEAQDALYYAAIAHCNLKDFAAALTLFALYRQQYPDDVRAEVFHFYAGLCQHRLGHYEAAVEEYGWFLLRQGGGQYKYFAALVASYMEAARLCTTPLALPYA
jgi:TolA-binding protein